MSDNKVETEVVKGTAKSEKKPEKKKVLKSAKGDDKSPIKLIIESIEKLTVLELVDLVKAIEEKFGVSASAPVSFAAVPQTKEDKEEKDVKEEKTDFTVVLTGYGDKKIQVIKVIREITRLGLKEAKELVDKFPGNIKEGIVKEEAENIKKKVEEAGGTVELK